MTSQTQHKNDISRRHAWLAMLSITLLGMALHSYHLGFYRLWYDETFTASYCSPGVLVVAFARQGQIE